jgi:hypothetical protein
MHEGICLYEAKAERCDFFLPFLVTFAHWALFGLGIGI